MATLSRIMEGLLLKRSTKWDHQFIVRRQRIEILSKWNESIRRPELLESSWELLSYVGCHFFYGNHRIIQNWKLYRIRLYIYPHPPQSSHLASKLFLYTFSPFCALWRVISLPGFRPVLRVSKRFRFSCHLFLSLPYAKFEFLKWRFLYFVLFSWHRYTFSNVGNVQFYGGFYVISRPPWKF